MFCLKKKKKVWDEGIAGIGKVPEKRIEEDSIKKLGVEIVEKTLKFTGEDSVGLKGSSRGDTKQGL